MTFSASLTNYTYNNNADSTNESLPAGNKYLLWKRGEGIPMSFKKMT